MTFIIEISQFYDYVNTKNENEKKSGIFLWDVYKSDIIFHWS